MFQIPPCRHVPLGMENGGMSGESRVCRPVSKDTHRHQRKLVRAECVRQRNEVAIKLDIIFSLLSLSRHLLNLQEIVVIGFPNFAWAPKKNNKNSGKQKFDPAPPTLAPWGAIF